MKLLRRFAAMLTSAGFLSCGAVAAEWQDLSLPGAGAFRLRHPHRITTGDTAKATTTAQTLIGWTRSKAWDRLRVIVDDRHPLVIQFKAGDVLVLTPEDAALPIIWISLSKDPRALLEDRSTGRLSIFAPPPGKRLDLSWLGL
jgi:hypothetical protein